MTRTGKKPGHAAPETPEALALLLAQMEALYHLMPAVEAAAQPWLAAKWPDEATVEEGFDNMPV